MSWINPGMWYNLNAAWATNKVLKEDGVPQQERVEKIKELTGLNNLLPTWMSYGKYAFFAVLAMVIYVVYKRLCKYC